MYSYPSSKVAIVYQLCIVIYICQLCACVALSDPMGVSGGGGLGPKVPPLFCVQVDSNCNSQRDPHSPPHFKIPEPST